MSSIQMLKKGAPPAGVGPSLMLCNPRFPHNVGMSVRLGAPFEDTDPNQIGIYGETSWSPAEED